MSLRYRDLRDIESSLGVYLIQISATYKQPNQSFSVFQNILDEEAEPFIGDVVAADTFFRREELEGKIIEMIGNKSIEL